MENQNEATVLIAEFYSQPFSHLRVFCLVGSFFGGVGGAGKGWERLSFKVRQRPEMHFHINTE